MKLQTHPLTQLNIPKQMNGNNPYEDGPQTTVHEQECVGYFFYMLMKMHCLVIHQCDGV